jgi:hypothetical protein
MRVKFTTLLPVLPNEPVDCFMSDGVVSLELYPACDLLWRPTPAEYRQRPLFLPKGRISEVFFSYLKLHLLVEFTGWHLVCK